SVRRAGPARDRSAHRISTRGRRRPRGTRNLHVTSRRRPTPSRPQGPTVLIMNDQGRDADAGVPGVAPPATVAAPPSAFATSLGEFWAGRGRPVRVSTLAGCLLVGLAGGILLVGQRLGLGLAVVGVLVWVPAVASLVRRRAWGDLVLAGLSVA